MGHTKLVFDGYKPPTGNPDDCICGAKGNPDVGRNLLFCDCCDNVPTFKQVPCDCGDTFFDDPVREPEVSK